MALGHAAEHRRGPQHVFQHARPTEGLKDLPDFGGPGHFFFQELHVGPEQRHVGGGLDPSSAWSARYHGHLAKKRSGPQSRQQLGFGVIMLMSLDPNFTLGDDIEAVALVALLDDHGAGWRPLEDQLPGQAHEGLRAQGAEQRKEPAGLLTVLLQSLLGSLQRHLDTLLDESAVGGRGEVDAHLLRHGRRAGFPVVLERSPGVSVTLGQVLEQRDLFLGGPAALQDSDQGHGEISDLTVGSAQAGEGLLGESGRLCVPQSQREQMPRPQVRWVRLQHDRRDQLCHVRLSIGKAPCGQLVGRLLEKALKSFVVCHVWCLVSGPWCLNPFLRSKEETDPVASGPVTR